MRRCIAQCRCPRPNYPPCQSSNFIWISDSQLASAYERFERFISITSARFGSHVPGPLEAQKRASRRRITGLSSYPAQPVHDVGGLFGTRPANMPEPIWQSPGLTIDTPLLGAGLEHERLVIDRAYQEAQSREAQVRESLQPRKSLIDRVFGTLRQPAQHADKLHDRRLEKIESPTVTANRLLPPEQAVQSTNEHMPTGQSSESQGKQEERWADAEADPIPPAIEPRGQESMTKLINDLVTSADIVKEVNLCQTLLDRIQILGSYQDLMSSLPRLPALEYCVMYLLHHSGQEKPEDLLDKVDRFTNACLSLEPDDLGHFLVLLEFISKESQITPSDILKVGHAIMLHYGLAHLLLLTRALLVSQPRKSHGDFAGSNLLLLFVSSGHFFHDAAAHGQLYGAKVWLSIGKSICPYPRMSAQRISGQGLYTRTEELRLRMTIEEMMIAAAYDMELSHRKAFAMVEHLNARARDFGLPFSKNMLQAFIWTALIRPLSHASGYTNARAEFVLDLISRFYGVQARASMRKLLHAWQFDAQGLAKIRTNQAALDALKTTAVIQQPETDTLDQDSPEHVAVPEQEGYSRLTAVASALFEVMRSNHQTASMLVDTARHQPQVVQKSDGDALRLDAAPYGYKPPPGAFGRQKVPSTALLPANVAETLCVVEDRDAARSNQDYETPNLCKNTIDSMQSHIWNTITQASFTRSLPSWHPKAKADKTQKLKSAVRLKILAISSMPTPSSQTSVQTHSKRSRHHNPGAVSQKLNSSVSVETPSTRSILTRSERLNQYTFQNTNRLKRTQQSTELQMIQNVRPSHSTKFRGSSVVSEHQASSKPKRSPIAMQALKLKPKKRQALHSCGAIPSPNQERFDSKVFLFEHTQKNKDQTGARKIQWSKIQYNDSMIQASACTITQERLPLVTRRDCQPIPESVRHQRASLDFKPLSPESHATVIIESSCDHPQSKQYLYRMLDIGSATRNCQFTSIFPRVMYKQILNASPDLAIKRVAAKRRLAEKRRAADERVAHFSILGQKMLDKEKKLLALRGLLDNL